MGIAVVAMYVMRVVRSDHWCTNFLGDLQQLRIGLGLCSQTMVLNFDEKVVFAKDFLESGRFDFGVFVIVL